MFKETKNNDTKETKVNETKETKANEAKEFENEHELLDLVLPNVLDKANFKPETKTKMTSLIKNIGKLPFIKEFTNKIIEKSLILIKDLSNKLGLPTEKIAKVMEFVSTVITMAASVGLRMHPYLIAGNIVFSTLKLSTEDKTKIENGETVYDQNGNPLNFSDAEFKELEGINFATLMNDKDKEKLKSAMNDKNK